MRPKDAALAVTNLVPRFRLDSIRNQIFAFAVLATLIPSFSTTWLSYSQNKRSLQEKVRSQLQSVSSETGRELDLWLKERLYELRVFASSYEVSENLDRVSKSESQAQRRLNDYLNSVRVRFADYEELMVVDRQGRVVATSAPQAAPVNLPVDWASDIRAGNPAVGEPYWDESRHRVVVIAAVPIHVASGRLVGAFTAKINLRTVDDVLKRFAPVSSNPLYVITTEGRVITTSRSGSAEPMRAALPPATAQALLDHESGILEYTGLDHESVVGSLHRVPRLNWAVVAEIPTQEAFRQVIRLRNAMILILTALLVGVGLIAYILGLLIVRPVNRLAQGAAKVAGGDLDVDLPVPSGGEVGYLTEVFNNMVTRLREGRHALDAINETLRKKNEELEQLSITDGLTKLYNRRYLMERLATEIQRYRRHKRAFSVMMADVDHFKPYNDAHGHLAGDEILTRVGTILREVAREGDCSARYGGEEFVVVLTETEPAGAAEFCERLRARLATELFEGGKITLSIGIAEFPIHGDTPEKIIAAADAAMYRAKREGRDRIVLASPKRADETTKKRV
jgi:diguanylate cyclase (GGDEF)-like protein